MRARRSFASGRASPLAERGCCSPTADGYAAGAGSPIRDPVRAARDSFDGLGCSAWSDKGRYELRASGESSRPRDPAARDRLTPQELQIARLAADGLSNREIAERLYLSPRTISTHLYRVFPKLGISGRAELRDALSANRPGP